MTFNDNPIIVDSSYNKSKKKRIFCVLCFPKVQLECTDPEQLRYKCPRCKNTYQLGYEILEHEDDIVSSHEYEDIELSGLESDDSVGLLSAGDDNEFEDDDDDDDSTTIPVPKYMQDSDTVKVVEFKETIEED